MQVNGQIESEIWQPLKVVKVDKWLEEKRFTDDCRQHGVSFITQRDVPWFFV